METMIREATLDKDLDAFATWSWVFSLQYINQMERLLRPHGMTVAQFTILHHLVDPALKSGCKLSDIAEVVEVNLPAVVKIIDKFEALGLVTTQVQTQGRRSRFVTVTPLAETRLNEMKQSLGPFLHSLFGSLPSDDAQTVVRALKTMGESMHQTRAKPPHIPKKG